MLATSRLLQACRVTLFTRDGCGLCASAKAVLSDLGHRRPFVLREVDLARPESRPWRELYDFDIPVVRASFSFPFLSFPLPCLGTDLPRSLSA